MTDPSEAIAGSPGDASAALSPAVVGHSFAVAAWTILSRVTGLGKVVAIGAVLGPTYLGNTYQAINSLPNLVFYGFLGGSLFASLLVPPLVRHLDMKDWRAAKQLAGGFMGASMVGLALVTVVAILVGPLVIDVLSLGIVDRGVAAAQQRVGWPLLAMLMPQVVLYGVAGTAGAVMNARGRFALPAAAPALENVGIILTLGATAILFGTGRGLGEVSRLQLLVLGLGTTAAVALHAATLWWGARRSGFVLIPEAGWRNAEVRQVIRRTLSSMGQAGLGAVQTFAFLVVANRVAGGVVAFQLALNFFFLPIAVSAAPVAVALLPHLARLHHQGDRALFRDELVRGIALAFFVAVPAAVAYTALAFPLARAVSFGEMATETGVALIAASLAPLGVGVLGETVMVVFTRASYAQRDARTPLSSSALGIAVSLGGMVVAMFLRGPSILVALGLAFSVGYLVAATRLASRLRARLPRGRESTVSPLVRAAVASAIMLGPAYLTVVLLSRWVGGQAGELLALLAASVVGAASYLGLQKMWRSPELNSLLGGFGHLRA